MFRPYRIALSIALVAALPACAAIKKDLSKGINYFGGDKKEENAKRGIAPSKITAIGVNSYLYLATLDTVSFMPLLQSDSANGVVITDWYVNPATPSERMKLTVSILDQELRADALRVAASRQTLRSGQWIDAPVQAATVQKLEEIILTKARDLRRNSNPG
jgi:Domain of unknown function (DUF3576)